MPLTKLGSNSLGRNASQESMPTATGAKCATVTMMLAERMARRDWSVDDEHFFETNTMNVWQTLEFLSGVNLRKRYHYEGYNDTENRLRTLTPSWRRDSFVEKNAGASTDDKYPSERGGGGGGGGSGMVTATGSRVPSGQTERRGSTYTVGNQVKPKRKHRKRRGKKPVQEDLEAEYALSPANYTDLVKCTFNLPRISAALERLMGTNVVRLTDRKYMKDLGGRLEDDCRQQLLQRIRARELKEVERERILIIEGKSNIIPPELADDPIFLVNKTANKEIAKKRAKLKTNRERNAEHLKVQGVRWEREHLQHEDVERVRLEKQKEHKKEQLELEERYKEEDAERGMDLLRIDNEDWRACEQQLKEFLERERARMKERSLRMSTPFTSDPKDIQNIIRARQKFREIEHRIRQELEQQVKHPRVPPASKEVMARFAACAARKIAKAVTEEHTEVEKEEPKEIKELSKDSLFEMTQPFQRKYSDDASDLSSEEEVLEVGSSIEQSKRRHAAELEAETERDVQRGLLISKEQYHHLRFEEDKIVQLRKAKDIRELYQLAEEIIIGERFEDEVLEEEELEEEGEQHEFDDETDF